MSSLRSTVSFKSIIHTVVLTVALTALLAIGLLGTAPAALADPTDVGYRDFNYGSGTANPTAEKPQSKLWSNDGTWWGTLWDPSTQDWYIYKFDGATQSWSKTGTLVEKRHNAAPDVLWDGKHLYVATAPSSTSTTDQNAYVRRFSYNTENKSYTPDTGFQSTVVAQGRTETIVLDKDTTGKLWVTYTQGSKVYVNRSLASDSSWGTPFVLPVSGTTVDPDDISAVVAFESQIGVMWSNQTDGNFYFATHQDGAPDDVWRAEVARGGTKVADDHMNLKSLQADSSGRVFAAVKTSLGDTANPDANAPNIWVLVRGTEGTWKQPVTFGRVQDKHTRPMLIIDEEKRNLYVFATGPNSPGGTSPDGTGGTIYYKQASLDNISFPQGLGTPFIKSSTDTTINNATASKHNVNSATGILVLASDNTSKYYLHNTIATNPSPPPNTPPKVAVAGVTGGASYEKGSVPKAICNVTDTEDGSSSFDATLSSVTGTYASDGIGSQTASCSYTDGGGLKASSSETYSIVDPSAPVITKTVTGQQGDNGWYTGNVDVDWTVSEPQSPNSLQTTGCNDQTITADQAETTYSCSATSAGGSAPEQSVTIKRDATAPTNINFVGGPNAGGSYDFGGVPNEPTCTADDATSTLNTCVVTGYSNAVGDQTLTATATDKAGNKSTATRSYTVNKAAQAITFAPLADKTFGDDNFTVSATGGASGEAVTFSAAGNCTVSGNTVHITGAGNCTVTASQAGNNNYFAAKDVAHTFSIDRAATTTTITCGAGPFTYDGSRQTPCEATVTGFALNAPVTVDYQNNVNAGTATASASYAGDGNYKPSSGQKSFTITERAIQVTADSHTKLLGAADPALTYKVTSGSLVAGDSFSGALTRAPGETVEGSPYAITQGTLSLGNNYGLTVVPGTLKIIYNDTSEPTVSSVTPADAATNVAPVDNVEATFSEDMDSSTLTTSTFTLTEQGSTTPVAAAVSYASATKKATLNPDADLKANTTYTATLKGGSNGAKDAAGNPLGSDKTWSFTVYVPPPPPTTIKQEAETGVTLSGKNVKVRRNAAASGGQEVAFYNVGSASYSLSGSASSIILRAREDACNGDPILSVFVDGTKQGSVTVNGGANFADYKVPLSGLDDGDHTYRIEYNNDAATGCDRNVFLDYFGRVK